MAVWSKLFAGFEIFKIVQKKLSSETLGLFKKKLLALLVKLNIKSWGLLFS